jgi:hypothetical protein
MDVCVRLFCIFTVLCVQVAALQWADPTSMNSSDRVEIKKQKSGQGPKMALEP